MEGFAVPFDCETISSELIGSYWNGVINPVTGKGNPPTDNIRLNGNEMSNIYILLVNSN